jgi:hypothetical protein
MPPLVFITVLLQFKVQNDEEYTYHFNIFINVRARLNFVMAVLVVLVFHLDDLRQDVEGVVVVVVDTGSNEKTLKETPIFMYLEYNECYEYRSRLESISR